MAEHDEARLARVLVGAGRGDVEADADIGLRAST